MNDNERQTAANDGMTRRRWPRWLGMVLLGVVILGSGIVIGSVGTLMVVRKAMVRAVEHPEQMPERATNRMARRYDLTERQQTEVEAILRERLQRMARIRHQMRPRLDAELDSLREEVAGVLTDEQAAAWREDMGRLRDAIQVPMNAPHAPPNDGATAPRSE